jgi:uncharacterized membrane-anchored protein
MKAVVTRALILVATLIVLVAVNGSIVAKERLKSHGQRIYLELAPVDPRSLMQGDYLALRFRIAQNLSTEASGSAALHIDERGVATLDPQPTVASPRIRYRVRNGSIWLGTNAYFFEEGTAERYAGAQYGEFRLDPDSGEAVLVGLRDANLSDLGSAAASSTSIPP